MKLIDFLNKLYNDNKQPQQIKFNNMIWDYSSYYADYVYEKETQLFADYLKGVFLSSLCDEVEIIEEEPKEIKKLEVPDCNFLNSRINYKELLYYQNKNNIAFMNTFKEVIEAINELKGKE